MWTSRYQKVISASFWHFRNCPGSKPVNNFWFLSILIIVALVAAVFIEYQVKAEEYVTIGVWVPAIGKTDANSTDLHNERIISPSLRNGINHSRW
jgi:hypothetical protein